ncbi:MAG: carboxylating nicotinate-nucleotide diphosphorylase [Actinomycetes bacterium]
MTLSLQLRTMIESYQLDPIYIEDLVVRTIAEDLAGGLDVTSEATIPADQISVAQFHSRKAGVVSGLCIAAAVLEVRGITDYKIVRAEGDHIEAGQLLLTATGNTRQLLLSERTALNFLGRLSGISSLTKRWVDDVKGTGVEIRDTRKTTPLLRDLEKFAVRMGGGTNHRMSLSDAALIKDNHIVAAGGVTQAFKAVRAAFPNIAVEVEVDRLEQLRDVVDAGADLVLLDNMSLEQCRAAVAMVKGRTKLEASGGLTLENAHAYANTGVNYLAVGALTHSAPVLDIGLDFKAE